MSRVAVVTGSNKGIGFAIVRGLCKQFKGDVYLTSRDIVRGQEAVEQLRKEGLEPKFHQLDVCDKASIETLKTFLQSQYDGLDLLVNNAGIAFVMDKVTPIVEQAELTIRTNYFAVLNVCDFLFPILKPGARVVHISSSTSTMCLARLTEEKKNMFVNTTDVEDVTSLMNEYIIDVKEGKAKERGWFDFSYGISKTGVTSITPIQQSHMDTKRPDDDIVINSCCPGIVDTDLMKGLKTKNKPLCPDEGADTPLYLALLPVGTKEVKGCFCHLRKVFNWKAGQYP